METKIRIFILIGISIVVTNAGPASQFRSSFRVRNSLPKFARQELPPPPEESNGASSTPESEAAPSAPYPPSGWKPSGRAFPLPTEKKPEQEYGPPDNTYGPPETTTTPPDTSYGPPDNTYGPPQELTTEKPSGPYPASGWKPSGRAFPLPTEQEAEPESTYGPPPDNTYGPPDSTTVATPDIEDDTVIVDVPITGEPEAFFYVRLPNGTIQKISFSPTKSSEQFRSARLQQNPRKGISYVSQYQSW